MSMITKGVAALGSSIGKIASTTALKSFKAITKFGKAIQGAEGSSKKVKGMFDKMGLIEPFADIFSGWTELLGGAFAPIIEKIVPLMAMLTPYLVKFTDKIAEFFTLLTTKEGWSKIGDWFKNAWTGIKDWFRAKIVDPIKAAWQTITNWFNAHIIDPIKNAWNRFMNHIINFINVIITGINYLIPGTEWDIQLLSVSV